jgi:hypothetical protein
MISEKDKLPITKLLEEKNIGFTPSIEISISRLNDIPLFELDMNNKDGIYNQVRRAIKPIVNYGWDNGILRVSNGFGDEFSFMIRLVKYKGVPSTWEISTWDYTGNKAIGTWHKKYESNDDKLTIDEIKPIKEKMDDFTRNIIHCSDCKTTMPISKHVSFNSDIHKERYGGQYFAGHYCTKCWERKWKAIEAKENYE